MGDILEVLESIVYTELDDLPDDWLALNNDGAYQRVYEQDETNCHTLL